MWVTVRKVVRKSWGAEDMMTGIIWVYKGKGHASQTQPLAKSGV